MINVPWKEKEQLNEIKEIVEIFANFNDTYDRVWYIPKKKIILGKHKGKYSISKIKKWIEWDEFCKLL